MSVTVRFSLARPRPPSANRAPQLHTDLGDLKIELFCESVPKTAEVRAALPPPRCAAPADCRRTSSPSAPPASMTPRPSTA